MLVVEMVEMELLQMELLQQVLRVLQIQDRVLDQPTRLKHQAVQELLL
jgi:hypothetical protein